MEDKTKARDLEERTFQFAQSIRVFVKQLRLAWDLEVGTWEFAQQVI